MNNFLYFSQRYHMTNTELHSENFNFGIIQNITSITKEPRTVVVVILSFIEITITTDIILSFVLIIKGRSKTSIC